MSDLHGSSWIFMDLHNSQKFSMDFSKAWRSAAVQLRVYQSRWSTLLAQKSLVWIPHSRGWMRHRAKPFSSFFILQILMILPCKRCCHLLSLSFRRRHSHRPVCKLSLMNIYFLVPSDCIRSRSPIACAAGPTAQPAQASYIITSSYWSYMIAYIYIYMTS